MNFEVRAVPQDVYDTYLGFRQTLNPATGAPYTAAQALTATGEEIPSCGELCAPLATTTAPLNTDRTDKGADEPVPGGS
jgi:cytochrome c oxidase subunit 2